ncbi:hypothetical protein QYF68_12655 [Mycolicibacterium austroafricanum]|uniref:Uncharacterized protein n=1 Tax=Mycolicibacterium austroafricanum TaxID=39687 RepID=A0ABT8HD27_MYCAO|nr:hypothetical protein [Mycolicibacterium austroafricanum]MDN4518668.1 hypothetical protein [Mycolicibacterium austroafricanum]
MDDEVSRANSRGFELGRRHAAVAEAIGQAVGWARAFRVATSDDLSDGSVFVTYPLLRHGDILMTLWNRLGGACIDLACSFQGGVEVQNLSVPTPSCASALQSTSYLSGAPYVCALQSSSQGCSTLQDHWRDEVDRASTYLSVSGICTDELERYAAFAQSLFDEASAAVRDAYAHAVAATYGRMWAGASRAGEGRALIAWMKALAGVGFSFDECLSELRDLELVSPEAVSYCLDSRSEWLDGK